MSNELSVIEIQNPALVFVPQGLDPLIERISAEARAEAIALDISTTKGRDAIRSLAVKVRSAKTTIEKMGKDLVSDEKARLKLVDLERGRAWDRMQALEEEVRAPLTEWENSERDRVAGHESVLASMAELTTILLPVTTGIISENIESLHARHNSRDWQEFSVRAKAEYDRVLKALSEMLEAQKKAEAEAAELARLRAEEAARQQAEREAKVAAEAAAAATKAAEEKAAQEAAAVAAKAKEEADALAKVLSDALASADAAEKARIASEAQAKKDADAAVQAEKDRAAAATKAEEAATAAREADKAYKAKIHNEIKTALQEVIAAVPADAEDRVKYLVIAIAKGAIPHVSIRY